MYNKTHLTSTKLGEYPVNVEASKIKLSNTVTGFSITFSNVPERMKTVVVTEPKDVSIDYMDRRYAVSKHEIDRIIKPLL